MTNSNCFRLGTFLLLTLSISCLRIRPVYFDGDKRLGHDCVVRFRELLDEEDYEHLYSLFTLRAQDAEGKEKIISMLREMRKRDGKVVGSILVKSEIEPQASSRAVHLLFKTDFEKRQAGEEFSIIVNNNEALIDFYVRPTLAELADQQAHEN